MVAEAMTYTVGKVRFLLQSYQRLAQGARVRPREDRLGSRPPPLDEASFAATAREKADLECALRSLSFERQQMIFMMCCLGESTWRNGTKKFTWRARVADWWALTPGDVKKAEGEIVEELAATLNGTSVDNST